MSKLVFFFFQYIFSILLLNVKYTFRLIFFSFCMFALVAVLFVSSLSLSLFSLFPLPLPSLLLHLWTLSIQLDALTQALCVYMCVHQEKQCSYIRCCSLSYFIVLCTLTHKTKRGSKLVELLRRNRNTRTIFFFLLTLL